METVKSIWNIINSRIFGYAVFFVAIFLLIQTCQSRINFNSEIDRYKQNHSALLDTIREEKLKSGKLQYSIQSLILNERELREYNENLYADLLEQQGKVRSITRANILLKQNESQLLKYIDSLKSVLEEPIKVNDSVYLVPWTLAYTYDENNYDLFSGRTRIGVYGMGLNSEKIRITNLGSQMIDRTTQIELVWGQKWEDGKLRVFVNSKYPGFSATNLEGVLLDVDRKKNWFTGFGVGPQFGMGWNFVQSEPALYIGLGVQYNIYQW